MRVLFVSFLLLMPLAACGDGASENDAARAAAVFYDIRLSERAGGVPEGDFRTRLRPVISPGLDSLLAQAAEAERRHTERTDNSEPPYLQGDIFSSLFEGATGYEIGKCEADGETVACDVLLVHDAPEQPVQWTDRVVLVSANGRWAVDDIHYGGDWDFASKGTLQQMLKAVIAEEE
ncbi:MAG: hypothetical protein Q7V31_13715 [Parvibaculum sp.]|uniref:hypothetical protein n=1 Tax=Parvibaculum sp. TaxID=2024848 RepID=UPI00271A5B90|nr:hypothetical protein [Parvibaculum sp.]MDO8839976.1 hypothetical protein [Parvibaculum sp.]